LEMLHEEVKKHASASGDSPDRVALLGGEDYALLTALAPDTLPQAQALVPDLRVISTVTAAPAITVNGAPLTLPGFDHFGG